MKKFLSLAIVLALAVASFASCGGDEADTTAANKQPAVTTSASTNAPADTDADTTVADGTTADTTTADTTVADGTTDGSATTPGTDGSVDYDTTNLLLGLNFREEFEFDDNWTVGSGTPNISGEQENGVLKIEYEGADPMIIRESLDETIATADIKTIELRVKNVSSDTGAQLFFGTTDTDFSETATIKFTYTNSGENADWEVITLNVADYASTLTTFTGDLTKVRFDPNDQGQEGTIYVDYIVFRG